MRRSVPRTPETPEAVVSAAAPGHRRLAVGGLVGGEAVTWAGDPSGRFQIGSVTKVFTGLLLATYVVDGTVALDDPVGALVDDLAGPVRDVTLEQLATHTSGLPRIPQELWSRALSRHPDPYGDIDHEALVRSLASTRLRRRRRPAYSNLGAGLLGHALAVRAGSPYAELVRERVAGPLGLRTTGVDPEGGLPGHRRRGRPRAQAWTFDALAGCGALWSTLADLQRFLAAQLEPPPGPLGDAIRLSQEPRVPGARMDHCLGWLRLHGRDGVLLWHNGGTAGYRSFVGVDPDHRVAVAALTASDRSVDGLGIRLGQSLAQG